MFTVDQKVHCKTYGEGVVVDVSRDVDETYPVAVEFASGEWDFYMEDGKLCYLDDEPSLSVIEE